MCVFSVCKTRIHACTRNPTFPCSNALTTDTLWLVCRCVCVQDHEVGSLNMASDTEGVLHASYTAAAAGPIRAYTDPHKPQVPVTTSRYNRVSQPLHPGGKTHATHITGSPHAHATVPHTHHDAVLDRLEPRHGPMHVNDDPRLHPHPGVPHTHHNATKPSPHPHPGVPHTHHNAAPHSLRTRHGLRLSQVLRVRASDSYSSNSNLGTDTEGSDTAATADSWGSASVSRPYHSGTGTDSMGSGSRATTDASESGSERKGGMGAAVHARRGGVGVGGRPRGGQGVSVSRAGVKAETAAVARWVRPPAFSACIYVCMLVCVCVCVSGRNTVVEGRLM